MFIVEKHFTFSFGSAVTNYLYKLEAPREGFVSKLAIKRIDGNGFTAYLLSNPFRQPNNGNVPASNIISTHDEELLKIMKITTAGNFAEEIIEFGKPYRNLHIFRHQPSVQNLDYPDVSGDNYLFLYVTVSPAANASFAVSITICSSLD